KKVGANPGSGDAYYPQYLVEQAAVGGALNFIKVDNQGTGYAVSSTTVPVTITGDGTGATAQGTTNAQGRLTAINITAAGSGYTWAKATIGGAGVGATATPIISPVAGHGSNIEKELDAHYIIIDVQLAY